MNELMSILGMYLAKDVKNDNEVWYIRKIATAWENSILVGGVQQNEAQKSMNSIIPQTMK